MPFDGLIIVEIEGQVTRKKAAFAFNRNGLHEMDVCSRRAVVHLIHIVLYIVNMANGHCANGTFD